MRRREKERKRERDIYIERERERERKETERETERDREREEINGVNEVFLRVVVVGCEVLDSVVDIVVVPCAVVDSETIMIIHLIIQSGGTLHLNSYLPNTHWTNYHMLFNS